MLMCWASQWGDDSAGVGGEPSRYSGQADSRFNLLRWERVSSDSRPSAAIFMDIAAAVNKKGGWDHDVANMLIPNIFTDEYMAQNPGAEVHRGQRMHKSMRRTCIELD